MNKQIEFKIINIILLISAAINIIMDRLDYANLFVSLTILYDVLVVLWNLKD